MIFFTSTIFSILFAVQLVNYVNGDLPGPLTVEAKTVTQSLFISNAYMGSEGKWGDVELCSDGSFVSAIEIKYQKPGFLADETAVTGVKLYCTDQHDGSATGYITSSVGNDGKWYGMQVCSSRKFLTGFRANVLASRGLVGDDVAVEDVEARCDEEIIDALPIPVPGRTKKFKAGEWSEWATCDSGRAVCGLQVKFEKDSLVNDHVNVADFALFCCDLLSLKLYNVTNTSRL